MGLPGTQDHVEEWGRQGSVSLPAGSITDLTSQASTYVKFNGGALGDYRLVSNSPGKAAADDGAGVGVNVNAAIGKFPESAEPARH